MATKAALTQSSKFGEFALAPSSSNSRVYTLDREANYKKSKAFLDESLLTPFGPHEILRILRKDESLMAFFSGKGFYVAGAGTEMHGIYTVKPNGSLEEGRGGSFEDTIRVESGDNPLILFVYSNHDAKFNNRRYNLLGSFEPVWTAPMVVGRPRLSIDEPVDDRLYAIEVAAANLRKSDTKLNLEQRLAELSKNTSDLIDLLRQE